MLRRAMLGGAGATLLLPLSVYAQGGQSVIIPPGVFQWRRPGYEPLIGLTAQQALEILILRGNVPPDIAAELRISLAEGPIGVETISYGAPSTVMLFGQGVAAGNVYAVTNTAEWEAMKAKGLDKKDVYRKVRDPKTKRVYSISRPHPCGNWCLLITDTFGVCIEDKGLCTPECARLRQAQFKV